MHDTSNPIHVCILTTGHPVDDVRLRRKLAESLVRDGVQVTWVGPDYKYVEGPKVVAYAVPFAGRGYSAPIEGFLGLESDLRTVRCMVVTYQAETPGLGGQVGSQPFLDCFRGKSIDGLRLVRPGKAQADNEVDSITGATLTSARFQAILDKTVSAVQSLRSTPEQPDAR